MTRVEKYRQYRKEISNMKFEVLTKKKKVVNQIGKMKENHIYDRLNYDEVMQIHNAYIDEEANLKKKRLIYITKYEFLYYIIALLVVLLLVVVLILLK